MLASRTETVSAPRLVLEIYRRFRLGSDVIMMLGVDRVPVVMEGAARFTATVSITEMLGETPLPPWFNT